MRFDNFEDLWAKFEQVFRSCRVDKQAAKNVFDVNFGTFRKTNEGDTPYMGESITYVDTNTREGKEYIAFHEGPVHIMPKNDQQLSSSEEGKAISFSPLTTQDTTYIQLMKIENGNLVLEKYYPSNDTLLIEVYDSKVVDMLTQQRVSYGNIHTIEHILSTMNLLPDKSINISGNYMVVKNAGMTSPMTTIDITSEMPFYNQAAAIAKEALEKTNSIQK